MSESQNDRLQIGKVITLVTASEQLAKIDGGYCDLRWALRFCLESSVRVCIRLSDPIHTWEGELDYGESCGKCSDISDEIDRLLLARARDIEADIEMDSEEVMPTYCENCHMIKPPMMGSSRYRKQKIGIRWGTFFLSSGRVQALCVPDIESFNFNTFYQFDGDEPTGYSRFDVVSDYDYALSIIREVDGLFNADLLPNDTSRVDSLEIGLKDLFVWKDDFDSALKGEGGEARAELPMNKKEDKSISKEKQARIWAKEYAAKNGIEKDVPISDEKLKEFRKAALDAGIAETTFNMVRKSLGFKGTSRSKKNLYLHPPYVKKTT